MPDTFRVWGFLIASALILLICLIKRRIVLRGMAFSAATGLGSLWLVSLLSGPLGLGVGMNALSAAVSALYGIPGVVGMLLLGLVIA